MRKKNRVGAPNRCGVLSFHWLVPSRASGSEQPAAGPRLYQAVYPDHNSFLLTSKPTIGSSTRLRRECRQAALPWLILPQSISEKVLLASSILFIIRSSYTTLFRPPTVARHFTCLEGVVGVLSNGFIAECSLFIFTLMAKLIRCLWLKSRNGAAW